MGAWIGLVLRPLGLQPHGHRALPGSSTPSYRNQSEVTRKLPGKEILESRGLAVEKSNNGGLRRQGELIGHLFRSQTPLGQGSVMDKRWNPEVKSAVVRIPEPSYF